MVNFNHEGPDVSYAQGNVNPADFPGDFANVNASRANVGLAVGSYYHRQVDAFRAAGRRIGHYFFNGNGNGNVSPTICAKFFVGNLYEQSGDGYDLDVEDEPGTGTVHWNPAQVLEFDDTLFLLTGKHLRTVYLNKSIRDAHDWSAVRARGIRLWIAWYNSTLPASDEWGDPIVWQYTSAGYDHNRATDEFFTAVAGGGAIPIQEDDMGLPVSFIADAQSDTIWLAGPLGYVGVASPYHLSLLQRVQKNTGGDKMLQAEVDIAYSYLRVVGAIPATLTLPDTQLVSIAESVANRISQSGLTFPHEFTITGKATA